MQDAPEGDITGSPAAPVAEAEREARAPSGPTISVESLIWVGLVTTAGALRLVQLASPSLSVEEGQRAFDATRVANGDVPPTWRGDLVEAATSYLFRVFGETDLVARLLPALAGVGLVGLLWFAKPYVGRVGALVAGVLLAFSPLFVLYSRSATPFSFGSFVAVLIMVSLFAYLRNPRSALAFLLIVGLALAPLTDAVAMLAALAALVFVVSDRLFFANEDVKRAWRALRRSPLQWVTALIVLAAALQFGITRLGTSLEGLDLPGVQLLREMFNAPRDSRQPEYHFALLLAYDWPILLGGAAGFAFIAIRLLRRLDTTPFERFVLTWTVAASLMLALTTRREAGQLLVLLLPLALLAGQLAEAIADRADWRATGRSWPAGAALVALAAAAAVLMTQWASGNADRAERLALLGAVSLGVVVVVVIIVRRRTRAIPVLAVAATVVAIVFVAHSSLAVAFSDGTEFGVDLKLTSRADELRDTVDRLARERGGTIVVDANLKDELGWTLRDSPVIFGGPTDRASAVISRPDANPAGFVAREETWRVAEGWYPDELLAPRRMWRWLLYREPYSDVNPADVRIFVRTI